MKKEGWNTSLKKYSHFISFICLKVKRVGFQSSKIAVMPKYMRGLSLGYRKKITASSLHPHHTHKHPHPRPFHTHTHPSSERGPWRDMAYCHPRFAAPAGRLAYSVAAVHLKEGSSLTSTGPTETVHVSSSEQGGANCAEGRKHGQFSKHLRTGS